MITRCVDCNHEELTPHKTCNCGCHVPATPDPRDARIASLEQQLATLSAIETKLNALSPPNFDKNGRCSLEQTVDWLIEQYRSVQRGAEITAEIAATAQRELETPPNTWHEVGELAKEAARAKGHDIQMFGPPRRPSSPAVRTGICEKCGGCCWIAHTPFGGYSSGGRLLMCECGTNEAMGLLPAKGKV